MNNMDTWGNDPSVQYMRQVFSRMEIVQRNLIKKLEISTFDPRLRTIRENARILFEKIWYNTDVQDFNLKDNDTSANVYSYCLAWSLNNAGIGVPEKFLPNDKRIINSIKEIL